MIIIVPWSFGDYKKAGINFELARIPLINQTGIWPGPMVSPLGFSMNASVPRWKVPEVVELMKYLLSPEVQLTFTNQFDAIPTRKDLYDDPAVRDNPLVRMSEYQMEVGRTMPIVPELRAVWDAMSPSYQAILWIRRGFRQTRSLTSLRYRQQLSCSA